MYKISIPLAIMAVFIGFNVDNIRAGIVRALPTIESYRSADLKVKSDDYLILVDRSTGEIFGARKHNGIWVDCKTGEKI